MIGKNAEKHGGLVLSRRVGQTVMIGRDITVTVVAVHGEQVRLKFTAPPDVGVDREEVFAAKEAERQTQH